MIIMIVFGIIPDGIPFLFPPKGPNAVATTPRKIMRRLFSPRKPVAKPMIPRKIVAKPRIEMQERIIIVMGCFDLREPRIKEMAIGVIMIKTPMIINTGDINAMNMPPTTAPMKRSITLFFSTQDNFLVGSIIFIPFLAICFLRLYHIF